MGIYSQIGAIPSSGNQTLIQTQVVSGASNVTFTNIGTGYDILKLVYYNLTGSVASTFVSGQVSYNNGVSYFSDNNYDLSQVAWSTGGSQGASVTTTSFHLTADLSNDTTGMTAGEMFIYGANNASQNAVLDSIGGCSYDTVATWKISNCYRGSQGAINAFKLFAASGTLSGTFKLYGIVN